MVPRLPVEISNVAAQAGLGRRAGVFRSLQSISGRTAWLIVGSTTTVAILVVLAGGAALGLALVPVVLLGLAAYRYLVPPESGRHWLAAYEQGFVELSPTVLRAVPWGAVTAVELDPFSLSLARPEFPVVAAEPCDGVVLADLVPRGRLVAVVGRFVPGSVGMARRDEWQRQSRRGLGSAVGLAALVLAPALVAAVGPHGGGVTPVAGASPGISPAYGRVLPDPVATTATPDVVVPTTPFSPTPFSPTPSAVPTDVDGYADVCGGTVVFAGAPAYAAPAPHFVYVSEDDAVLDVPDDWASDDPSQVQLVACVVHGTGAKIRTCRYSADDNGTVISQQLVRTTWDITVRETRTGTVVGHSNFQGGDTECAEFISVFAGTADPLQLTDPTADQLEGSIGRWVH